MLSAKVQRNQKGFRRIKKAQQSNPPISILIFDDSTSAIDAATEQKIRENLKEGAAGRITLIISHRLASLMHADQIVYLENGAILERGNPDELMDLNGHYARLYRLQIAF